MMKVPREFDRAFLETYVRNGLSDKKTSKLLKVTIAAALALVTPSFLATITGIIPEANAVTCSPTAGNHCYAYERKTITSYGNQAQTTVTQLTLPANYCTNGDFTVVATWVIMPNLNWVEMGYTIGKFDDGTCYATPRTYHAWSINGVYHEYNDGSVTVGSQPLYTVDDVGANSLWFFLKNGVSVDSKSASYATGANNQAGTEITSNSAVIPKTDINFIAYDSGPGSFNYWTSTTTTRIDNPPVWLIQCSPNYQHIKVGTGTTGTC